MRFPLDVILVYLRGYAVYPLSYRHLEKMMQDRCVLIGHSSSNRKAILRILRIGVRAAASMQASAPVHRALIGAFPLPLDPSGLSKQRRGLEQVSLAMLSRRQPIKSSSGRAWFA